MTDLEKQITQNLKLFPTTRYQGSKRRLLPWCFEIFNNIKFESVLDGFGGTASMSYLFKLMGKRVTYNDILLSNYQTGIALIENSKIKLLKSDLNFLLSDNGYNYQSFIKDTFEEIYYFTEENQWLDMIVYNIKKLSCIYSVNTLKKKQAIAYHALFQACLMKRPFNLFHRKNLNLRKSNVPRSFGNKKTWEIDFPILFSKFAHQTSEKIFSNRKSNKAICKDIVSMRKKNYDLIYLDPPYQRPKDKYPKDYYSLYHFLEGIVDYDNWSSRLDLTKKHKPLLKIVSEYENNTLLNNIEYILKKFNHSKIVISYGCPGKPTIKEIKELLLKYKNKVETYDTIYSYKLNKKNGDQLREVLLIGI